MAFAPVLERPTDTTEKEFSSAPVSFEEAHNARIRENYARLINPETRLDEVLGRRVATVEENIQAPVQAQTVQTPVQEIRQDVYQAAPAYVQGPYLVQSARTTAPIFRADSAINAKAVQTVEIQAEPVQSVVAQSDEEENEDLRPTQTTIQYKTPALSEKDEGRIEMEAQRHFVLSKKEKITIGVIVAAIITLLVLVIVNSAIISNLNRDLGTLQANLVTTTQNYTEISEKIYERENDLQAIEEYAAGHNMVKTGSGE